MRIFYDYQIFLTQRYGGISRYFYEIIKYLSDEQKMEIASSVLFSNNSYISSNEYIKHFDFYPNKQFRGKYRFMLTLNKLKSVFDLKHQNFDIFHPTYYDPYFLNYIGNKPFVLTIHDMTHEKFSNLFPGIDKTSRRKKLLAEKASKIIAVSNCTKNDIIELLGIPESKIEVIYHG